MCLNCIFQTTLLKFENLKPNYELDQYHFVHGGFNDKLENPFSDTHSMLWKSRDLYLNLLLKNRTIIHGQSLVALFFTQKQIVNK